jgi:hypothetical protein
VVITATIALIESRSSSCIAWSRLKALTHSLLHSCIVATSDFLDYCIIVKELKEIKIIILTDNMS